MTADTLAQFAALFVTFFVLIDAIGVAPIFATMTASGSSAYRRKMALRSTLYAAMIIFAFAFGGAWLLNAMHISIGAFRIAGGVLLFLIALDMVFEKRTERRESRAEDVLAEQNEAHSARHVEPDDISVFPIAIPMIAGPGTIASAMFYMSEATDLAGQSVVLAALAINLMLVALIFLAAGPIVKAMGPSLAAALTRILGVILTALAAQMVIDGIREAFGLVAST